MIGGGLAGCEASWQLAERGIPIDLYEMRPGSQTPAHRTGWLAELVCSNSLKSNQPNTASGLLKRELRLLGSLLLRVADEVAVPAGSALAVDRHRFGAGVTRVISEHPRIRLVRKELREIPAEIPSVLASGPLTSDALAEAIQEFLGQENLFFYDAIAPLVAAGSLDRGRIFIGSRYEKGEPAYLNCPLDESEYVTFYERLLAAERIPQRPFEKSSFFEGCMPIEELAQRGPRTLLFGPMRPVGLVDPRTGRQPHAVVQLRQDNVEASIYNLVGFQTRLRWGEQRQVFRLIPGLGRAEFLRYGSIHRNTFLCSPRVLAATLEIKSHRNIFVGGQLTGCEGYVESVATGLLAGLNLARVIQGGEPTIPPETTAIGSLCRYIAEADGDHFQPMNINFGILPSLERSPRGRERRSQMMARRALDDLAGWMKREEIRTGAQH